MVSEKNDTNQTINTRIGQPAHSLAAPKNHIALPIHEINTKTTTTNGIKSVFFTKNLKKAEKNTKKCR